MVQDINVVTGRRLLTAEQFQRLAEVPPESRQSLMPSVIGPFCK